MKKFILPLVLLVSLIGYSQSKSFENVEIRKEVKVKSVDVTVTVDSLEELESSISVNDIKEMFDITKPDEALSFKLVCNGDVMSNGKKSNMSYKIEGSTNDEETFLKRIEAIKSAAINYYKNKE